MTYEEADRICDIMWQMDISNSDIQQVREALEKQIPMKHKTIDNVLYCPCCESYHGRYGDISIPVGSKYCPYCGQAIDWSEVDD